MIHKQEGLAGGIGEEAELQEERLGGGRRHGRCRR